MLIPELGVHQTSERYFFTPSSLAKELFIIPTRLGHYFCSSRYSFNHRSEIALQVTTTKISCCFLCMMAQWN